MVFYFVLLTWFVLVMCFVEYRGLKERPHQRNKPVTDSSAREQTKKRAEQFSFIGWQVVKSFEELPEASRPSFDIVAAIKALDFKFKIVSVNAHFPYNEVRNVNGRVMCQCTNPRHDRHRSFDDKYRWDEKTNDWVEKKTKSPVRHDKCQKFADYTDLLDIMQGVRREIASQKRALEAQERAVQLAGMQNDLNSVESIMASLKAEREAISGATSDIRKQTYAIKER